MSEDENQNVEAEASDAAVPADSETMQDSQAQAQQKQDDDQAKNWAAARRKMQELENQNRDFQEKLSKMQNINQKPQEDDDDLSSLAKDDILTVEQAMKLAKKMARSEAEQVIKQREAATVDERLQNKYSDYAEVVTKETIELLKQTEPELALSLYHVPDPYQQGVAAYKLLKKLNSNNSSESITRDKNRAMENSKKPVSVNSVTKSSPIGNAHLFENGLTKELKTQLWDEMRQAMKSA